MRDQLQTSDTPIAINATLPTMIVFCHLRWDFVYQRPQQLLSRQSMGMLLRISGK